MADGNIDMKTIEAIQAQIGKYGDNIKALGDDTKRELTEMRGVIDANAGKVDAVVDERVTKFAASVETKQNAVETGLAEIRADVDKVATAMNRSGGAAWGSDEAAKEAKAAFDFHKVKMSKSGRLSVGAAIEPNAAEIKAWNEAFPIYLRRDDRNGAASFQAALQTGSDPDGGYLVPHETSTRIIQKVYETSPMRALATVETISGKDLDIPRDEGEVGYGWVGETETRPETTTAQVGMSNIVAHEMYAAPRVTQAMLEDAGINIEAWLARKVGDKFGRVEASAFFTGTGIGQPRGLMTYASGTTNGTIEQVVSGAATTFTFDGLKNLVFSLKDGYEPNASFQLNRLGVRDVSKLKDGEGRYLWEMSQKVGEPFTLLGYPVRRATDVAAPGAGALSAAFGDFREAYTIVDRLGISTIRDPLTAKPYVIFYSRRRVGGDVVNFEAVKIQVLST